MLKHILKLIKNQRKNNGWVFVELLIVFILLWRSVDTFLIQGIKSFQPEGFSVENVYKVTLAVRPHTSSAYIPYAEGSNEATTNLFRIIDRLKEHPDVEAVSLSSFYSMPFSYTNKTSTYFKDSVGINSLVYEVTPDYFRVFDIRLSDGELFSHPAEAFSNGYIISSTLGEALFKTEAATGKYITETQGDSVRHRVAAVTAPLKKNGFDSFQNVLFRPLTNGELYKTSEQELTRIQICFRTRPGVAGSTEYANRFKKEMKKSLSSGNYWLAEVQYYADFRTRFLDNSIDMNGRKIDIAINLFLLANVFLAIIGTFWFRIIRRRGELGLRMAFGSTRSNIQKLVIGEGLLILTVAAIPALLVCINIAHMELISTDVLPITVGRFLLVSVLTWVILAAIITLAVWYPSRKASRLEPVEALHYE